MKQLARDSRFITANLTRLSQSLSSCVGRLGIITTIGLACLGLSSGVIAEIHVYEFDDAEKNERFYSLIEELRCPKCQNQNLADSGAPLALDIKNRVHRLVTEGKSNSEITDYMVERYGDFVTYRPPFRPSTWVLWLGPIVLFVVVGLFIVIEVRRRSSDANDLLESVDQARVQDLLARYDVETDPLASDNDSISEAAAAVVSTPSSPSNNLPGK